MSFSFALTPALPHSGFSCTPCFLLPFLVTGEILFNASWAAHPAGTESLSLFVLKKSFFFFYFWNIFLLGIKFWLKDFFSFFWHFARHRGVFGRRAPRASVCGGGRAPPASSEVSSSPQF